MSVFKRDRRIILFKNGFYEGKRQVGQLLVEDGGLESFQNY